MDSLLATVSDARDMDELRIITPSDNEDSRSSSTSESQVRYRQKPSWQVRIRHSLSPFSVGKRKAYWNRAFLGMGIFLVLAGIAALVWFSLVITLIHRIRPKGMPFNGIQAIRHGWAGPSSSMDFLSPFPAEFSRDIIPKACHSHNDYVRRIPLFDALAVGCMSVEADIWLRKDTNNNNQLLVGHHPRALKWDRTLQSLYLDPLLTILENQNAPPEVEVGSNPTYPVGVFDTSPNTTLVLLVDFKENGMELWPYLMEQLEPLRQKGWLTHWDSATDTVTSGPVTVVGTGSTPFDAVVSNTTYRDIFFDAPLDHISSELYNSTNSYYASASISTVGQLWFGKFSSKQVSSIKLQLETASNKNLVSRYWATVSWPISWRDYTWKVLVDNGIGMLNVDDLVEATRWNWNWCVVAGLVLCGY